MRRFFIAKFEQKYCVKLCKTMTSVNTVYRGSLNILTHFIPLDTFYTPWKQGLLMFSEVLKETSDMSWVR